jgi:hypothetical protein
MKVLVQTAHDAAKANDGGGSPAPAVTFNPMGGSGVDLYYCMNETSNLAQTIGASLILSVNKMVQLIANIREAVQDAQKAALDPIIAQINQLDDTVKNGGDLSTSQGAELQGLNTQYTDTSTNFQQTQTTDGGLQDSETQSVSSISSSVENFITFVGKLNTIFQQTSSLVAN